MRRAVTCVLLAAMCIAVPCAVRAQAAEDSLESPWSLSHESGTRIVPAGQEGRTALMSTGGLMGLALYGWSIPSLTPHRTPQQAFELYALGTAASTLLPLAASTRWPVTRGVATMAANGAVRGAMHGALLYVAAGNTEAEFSGDSSPYSRNDFFDVGDTNTPEGNRRLLRYVLATSLAEAALGYACASAFRLSDGDAAAIATFGDFGMVAGDAVAQRSVTPKLDLYRHYRFDENTGHYVLLPRPTNADRRRIAFSMLAGGMTGQAAGAFLASHRHYTNGGATVLRAAGLLGVGAGFAVADGAHSSPDVRRRRCVGVIAGGAAGLAVGDRIAAGRAIAARSGVAVEGATLFCAAVGFGLSFGPRTEPSTRAVLASSLGGATAGFALGCLALIRQAPAPPDGAAGAWRVQLEPQGLLALTGSGPRPAAGAAPPLVTVSCRLP